MVGQKRILLLVVLLGAGVRLAHLVTLGASTMPKWHLVEQNSDPAVTWKIATDIRSGNLFGDPPIALRSDWMAALGSMNDWIRWWGSDKVFAQAPGYSYFVAAIAHPPDGSIMPLLFIQVLLGIGSIWLIIQLTLKWADERAALIAGLLAALSQAEIATECTMVRDALALPFMCAALFALTRISKPQRWTLFAALAGLLFSLATLVRENLLLLAVASPFFAWWLTRAFPERRAHVLTALCGGLFLGFAPMLFRNAYVGAPLFSLSTNGPLNVLLGLCTDKDCEPLGYQIPHRLGQWLEASRGSTLRAATLALTEAQSPADIAHLFIRKSWGFFSPYEAADSYKLDSLIAFSPVLRLAVPSGILVPVGMLGVLLSLRNWRRWLVPLVCLGLLFIPIFLVPMLWRLRVGIQPLLIPFAASAVVWCADNLAAHWKQKAPVIAATALFIVCMYLFPPKPLNRVRHIEFISSAQVYLREHQPELAIAELDRYFEFAEAHKAEDARVAGMRKYREQFLRDIEAAKSAR